MTTTLFRSDIPGLTKREGKVRDVYELEDSLILVATDRISAFDWVMPNPIPGKGQILTAMSLFWFDFLKVDHHLISTDVATFPEPFPKYLEQLQGRSMWVKKTEVVPFECVARGYLAGSGWKEYDAAQSVCGMPLARGLRNSERLPEPIFTPATKASSGHDLNVTFAYMADKLGLELAEELRKRTMEIYRRASNYTESHGIILADTKLEWGHLPDGSLILIDEVLTPDSSRFWPEEEYHVGTSPPSFDKQYVRDWLETTGWDKASPPPELPPAVVQKTQEKYQEALTRLTEKK